MPVSISQSQSYKYFVDRLWYKAGVEVDFSTWLRRLEVELCLGQACGFLYLTGFSWGPVS